MSQVNYTITPGKEQGWTLTIYATGVKTLRKSFSCKRYIDALRVVRQLQLHISTNDRVKAA